MLPVAVRYSYDILAGHSRRLPVDSDEFGSEKNRTDAATFISAIKIPGDQYDV